MKQPFDSKAELVIVTARVFGLIKDSFANLALDTGATMSLLSWDFLKYLGYLPAEANDQISITTGSGIEWVPKLTIKRLDVLGLQRKNFAILCHNLPATATVDGLLGLDFLRKRRLVLDFKKGILSLE